jgi:hypothetical protein
LPASRCSGDLPSTALWPYLCPRRGVPCSAHVTQGRLDACRPCRSPRNAAKDRVPCSSRWGPMTSCPKGRSCLSGVVLSGLRGNFYGPHKLSDLQREGRMAISAVVIASTTASAHRVQACLGGCQSSRVAPAGGIPCLRSSSRVVACGHPEEGLAWHHACSRDVWMRVDVDHTPACIIPPAMLDVFGARQIKQRL